MAQKRREEMSKQKALTKSAERPRKGGSPEKIDIALALDLRMKGLSYQVIADHFDCSKSAVIQRLKPYASDLEVDTDVYLKNRANILANRQAAVLAGLSGEKIEKASARDLAIVFGTLYDKERLERGQSTQNVAQFWASAVIDADKDATGKARPEAFEITNVAE
jgi:hypothetical protein